MEALIVKAEFSNINLIYFSVCLRTAYLFMDRTGLAGDLWMNMYLDEDFNSIPLMMKYKILKDYKEEGGMDFDMDEIIKIEKHCLKEAKMKHRPVAGFTVFKKGESAINTWLKARTHFTTGLSSTSGLLPLKDIIESDVFSLYKLDKREQVPNISPNIFIKPSELLQFKCPEHGMDNTLFTVTDDFTNPDFLEDKRIYKTNSKEALLADNIYLEKCLTFPVTTELSVSELKILRSILEELTTPLNEVLDIWVDMFIEKEDKLERINFLSNNILPMLPKIQTIINNNETLHYAQKRNSDITVEVWLGEAPLTVIWEYYNYFELISEESYKILLSSSANNTDYNFNVPIMMISTKGSGKNKIETLSESYTDEIEEPEILPVRKSILIND